MPLVDYDSSSDDSDAEQASARTPAVVAPVTTTHAPPTAISKDSIASFLPAPKNRQPQTVPRARVLGAGIKNTINLQAAHNPDNIVIPRVNATVTSLVPTSLRNKLQNKTPSAPTLPAPESRTVPSAVNLTLFQSATTRAKPVIDHQTKIEIKPFEKDEDGDIELEDDNHEHQSGLKRPHEETDIKEFNVSQFYDQNAELKAQGLLQENKRLHTVTNHKNQLSALVKNAQQDKDLLEEKFERNKKVRKEKGDRYGW